MGILLLDVFQLGLRFAERRDALTPPPAPLARAQTIRVPLLAAETPRGTLKQRQTRVQRQHIFLAESLLDCRCQRIARPSTCTTLQEPDTPDNVQDNRHMPNQPSEHLHQSLLDLVCPRPQRFAKINVLWFRWALRHCHNWKTFLQTRIATVSTWQWRKFG